MSGFPTPWDSADSSSPEWDPEDAGAEYHFFLDAARSDRSQREHDTIVTEGAARAIEAGAPVSALTLTVRQNSLALEAGDHIWFHVLAALTREARQGCAPCQELEEVLGRVLFSL